MVVPPFDPAEEAPGIRRLCFSSHLGHWSLALADPPPALADAVVQLWETHGFVDYSREKILPRGTVELIFNLGEPFDTLDGADLSRIDRFRSAWVSGLQQRPLMVAPCYDVGRYGSMMVAASLTAHGAYRLLGLPGRLLADRVVELADIYGPRDVEDLRQRMFAARTTRRRFDLLAGMLLRWRGQLGREPAPCIVHSLRRLERSGGTERVESLSQGCGVSRKWLASRFHEEIGMTPKRYARVLRFATLVGHLEQAATVHWPELAVAFGYYDQAHLVRDFRDFSGETPTRFMQARAADGQSLLYD